MTSQWAFDEHNPGASGFFTQKNQDTFTVQIRAFSEILNQIPEKVSLAKIDIEGSEYDLLDSTPEPLWQKIDMISIELHENTPGKISPADFLDHMRKIGFKIER